MVDYLSEPEIKEGKCTVCDISMEEDGIYSTIYLKADLR